MSKILVLNPFDYYELLRSMSNYRKNVFTIQVIDGYIEVPKESGELYKLDIGKKPITSRAKEAEAKWEKGYKV